MPEYHFAAQQQAKTAAVPHTRSLYEREEDGSEKDVMHLLANADNVVYLTRNPARPGGGFRLNGPLANHYPDFIAHTAKGNTLLIETKGDTYTNDDSTCKRRMALPGPRPLAANTNTIWCSTSWRYPVPSA